MSFSYVDDVDVDVDVDDDGCGRQTTLRQNYFVALSSALSSAMIIVFFGHTLSHDSSSLNSDLSLFIATIHKFENYFVVTIKQIGWGKRVKEV